MSADEFWKDDPQLFVSYRISFINKKKREFEETDYKSWLTGLYIHDGNGKLFTSLKQFISNILAGIFKGKKDNTEINTYPKKPYTELARDKEKQEKEKQEKNKYQNFHNSLLYYGTIKQRYLDNLKNEGKR